MIEMTAMLGSVKRPKWLGGIVSMMISPPLVSSVVRVQPPGQLDTRTPAGTVNGAPMTKVFGEVGVRWTVTTLVALTVAVTRPKGVWT